MREVALSDHHRAFGLALRESRLKRHYGLTEFARKARINRAHLHELEEGNADPHLSTWVQLVNTLDMSQDEFYFAYRRHRTEFTPAAFRFNREVRPGGILIVPRVGRIDISREAAFLIEVYTTAQRDGISKVLFDLSEAILDFSDQEQWRVTIQIIEWMDKNGYHPILAIVSNAPTFGITVAQREGVLIGTFGSRDEAEEWLKSQSLGAWPS